MLFLILASSYFLIGRIQAYPKGECPPHADCGVFFHCRKGYIRQEDRCSIDPSLKLKAQNICQAVVEQLQFDYG